MGTVTELFDVLKQKKVTKSLNYRYSHIDCTDSKVLKAKMQNELNRRDKKVKNSDS